MSAPDQPPSPPTSRGDTIPKPSPGGPGATANQLMDHLQKQLKDGEGSSGGDAASVSGHSTTSSSGRRRRRRNKNTLARQAASGGNTTTTTNLTGPGGAHSLLGLGGGGPSGLGPMVPKPTNNNGDGKTPKLKIDLNLDVNLELKAQLKGDLCLSLVVEDKYSDRGGSPEMKMPREGEHVTTELFYMRVGRLRFRRTWVDERALMRGQFFLTALSAAVLLAAGFLMGLSASDYMHGGSLAYRQQQQRHYTGGGGLVVSSSSVLPSTSSSSWLVAGDVGDVCDCNIDMALRAVGNTNTTVPS